VLFEDVVAPAATAKIASTGLPMLVVSVGTDKTADPTARYDKRIEKTFKPVIGAAGSTSAGPRWSPIIQPSIVALPRAGGPGQMSGVVRPPAADLAPKATSGIPRAFITLTDVNEQWRRGERCVRSGSPGWAQEDR
jgi:hypothetical protein